MCVWTHSSGDFEERTIKYTQAGLSTRSYCHGYSMCQNSFQQFPYIGECPYVGGVYAENNAIRSVPTMDLNGADNAIMDRL